MPLSRKSIGDVMRSVGSEVRMAATRNLQAAVVQWLEANKAELLAAISQAQYERGAGVLHAFCERFPLLSGFVVVAMNGTAAQAIDAIGVYDAQLAADLRNYEPQFEELQECWKKGREAAQ